MSDEILNTEQRTAIGVLLTELRSEVSYGYRRRQGENWFVQRAIKGDTVELAASLCQIADVADRMKNDDLPDDLVDNEAMQDFITYVDMEATRNWTQPYDIEVADMIIEGFMDAANATGARVAQSRT